MTGRDEAMRRLEHEIALLLRRVRRGIAERAAEVHPELNATSYSLLVTLGELGPHRAADLSELFSLDKGAVSRVVRQLLDLGLIERTPDPQDGRASILAITSVARTRLGRMNDGRRQELDRRLVDWDPADIGELASNLARFNTTLAQESDR